MFKNIYVKPLLLAILAVFIISIPAFSHASVKPVVKQFDVPRDGFTSVGKHFYPVYVIAGGLNSYMWTSVSEGKTVSLTAVELANSDMIYVDKDLIKDKKILKCGFICKTFDNKIVGLNPAFKYLRKE